jgi:hypothetical protein
MEEIINNETIKESLKKGLEISEKGFTFSQALIFARNGYKIARTGWSRIFLMYFNPVKNPPLSQKEFVLVGGMTKALLLFSVDSDHCLLKWIPTPEDMFSDDWNIIIA